MDVFVVVLAEEHDGGGMRLELQRALEFDEQDKRLGQDTYSVGTEQGATYYGGVESWKVVGSELKIVLDIRAATALSVNEGFLIELEADAGTLTQLKKGLQRVLNAVG